MALGVGGEPLDLRRRDTAPVTLVADGADLVVAVPTAQGVDADTERAGGLAKAEIDIYLSIAYVT
jgi:hypothetical protein